MASTYLTKTFSTNSNRKKFTVSVWVKKSQHLSGKVIWGSGDGSGYVWLVSGGSLYFQQNPSSTIEFNSSAKLRDPNGWLHFVQQVDTAQATASNRMKFWINGEQVTSWVTQTYPSQNSDLNFTSSNYPLQIGMYGNSYWDGSMSHFHWCDGYAYEADSFGSQDVLTGEWKINTSPNVQYGTNGFFILKDGNSVTDQSGNGNNFTVAGGTLTKTEDNPSNVFATYNSLYKPRGTAQYNNGNTTISSNATNWDLGLSTICPTAGKYYFEVKINDNDASKFSIGAVDVDRDNSFVNALETYSYLGYRGMGYYGNGEVIGHSGSSENSNIITGLSTFTTNDIIGCAVDLDNNKMYWHKNGTYIQYGGYTQNPSSGSYGVDFSNNRDGTNAVAMGGSIRDGRAIYTNYGNGYFGTTAVSSAGTNASGNGIFEYDVPTGFTALSTKGLNL